MTHPFAMKDAELENVTAVELTKAEIEQVAQASCFSLLPITPYTLTKSINPTSLESLSFGFARKPSQQFIISMLLLFLTRPSTFSTSTNWRQNIFIELTRGNVVAYQGILYIH
jgi:hypothetical protein